MPGKLSLGTLYQTGTNFRFNILGGGAPYKEKHVNRSDSRRTPHWQVPQTPANKYWLY